MCVRVYNYSARSGNICVELFVAAGDGAGVSLNGDGAGVAAPRLVDDDHLLLLAGAANQTDQAVSLALFQALDIEAEDFRGSLIAKKSFAATHIFIFIA